MKKLVSLILALMLATMLIVVTVSCDNDSDIVPVPESTGTESVEDIDTDEETEESTTEEESLSENTSDEEASTDSSSEVSSSEDSSSEVSSSEDSSSEDIPSEESSSEESSSEESSSEESSSEESSSEDSSSEESSSEDSSSEDSSSDTEGSGDAGGDGVDEELVFVDDEDFDIPSTAIVGTAIENIDVSDSVSGGKAPYTFTATGLPSGITISAEGVISGTPTANADIAAGTATITVTDADGATKSIEIAYSNIHKHVQSEVKYDETSHWFECAGCEEKLDLAEHTAQDAIFSNETDHWHKCACGAEVDKKAHSYTIEQWDNDGHWKECECGAEDTHVAHNRATEWTSDENGHWHACDGCDVKLDYAAHTPKSSTREKNETHDWLVCECGAKIDEKPHNYTTEKWDDDEHWKECGCGATNTPVAHTESENWTVEGGEHWKTCSGCSAKLDLGDCAANTGSWGGYDANGHWHNCKDCGTALAKEAHKMTEKPVEGENNQHYLECLDGCGYKNAVESCLDNLENKKDGTHHWKQCKDCGREIDKDEHAYTIKGFDGTYHWLECECGAMDDSTKARHTAQGTYSKDGNMHWLACTDAECGVKLDEEQHTFSNELVEDGNVHYYICECGEKKDEKAHTPKEDKWQNDSSGHWHVCSCGKKIDFSGHSSTSQATETEPQTCDSCGYIMATATGHVTHTKGSVYGYDETNHWLKCTGCETEEGRFEVEEHVWSCVSDGSGGHHFVCECGKSTNTVGHTLETEYDDTHHWLGCTVEGCGYKENEVEHTYDKYESINSSNHGLYCACGKLDSTNSHTMKDKGDSTHHWKECEFCEYSTVDAKVPHEYEIVDLKDGVYHQEECKCGATRNKASHRMDWSEDSTEYLHWKECEVCGYESEKSGHTYPTNVSISDTQHQAKCECGKLGEKADHILVWDEDTEGNHWQYCSGCTYATEKTPHNHNIYEDLKDGHSHKIKCVCGNVSGTGLHDLKWTEDDEGNHWQECNDCDYATDPKPHSFNNYDSTKATATHHTPKCECGKLATEEEHIFEWGNSKTDDQHWYKCKYCGYTTEEKDHDFTHNVPVEGGAMHQPTCECGATDTAKPHGLKWTFNDEGKHWQYCDGCEYTTTLADHSFSTDWTTDETGHWHECICSAKNDEDVHDYADAYTTNGTHHWHECECGVKTEEIAHDYTKGNYDASGHWHECECGVKTTVENHSYANDYDAFCDCGYERDLDAIVPGGKDEEDGGDYAPIG